MRKHQAIFININNLFRDKMHVQKSTINTAKHALG